MKFASLRVITGDVRRLVEFYEQATGVGPTWYTDDFAELAFPSFTLAVGSRRTMDLFGAGAARTGENHSAIFEFLVDDVDRDYERLQGIVSDFVQTPTTQPWGNRSLLFRDPDGNLVNFFTPVTPGAIRKFNP